MILSAVSLPASIWSLGSQFGCRMHLAVVRIHLRGTDNQLNSLLLITRFLLFNFTGL